jgi:hypothetical protein
MVIPEGFESIQLYVTIEMIRIQKHVKEMSHLHFSGTLPIGSDFRVCCRLPLSRAR